MKFRQLLAIALCLTSLAVPAQGKPPYVRLIDASPGLPFASPQHAAGLGPHLYGDAAVRALQALQTFGYGLAELPAATKAGLERAAREGVSGALLRKTYIEFDNDPARPLGKGVIVVGVGMSPTDACINGRCWERLEPLPSGARFTDDSDFFWLSVSPTTSGLVTSSVEVYPNIGGAFEKHAQLTFFSGSFQNQQKNSAWSRKIIRQTEIAAAFAEGDVFREQARNLLASQAKAADEYTKVEQRLAREAERARRAARAGRLNEALSQVLTVAASVGIASSILGEPLAATSANELKALLKAAESKSQSRQAGLQAVQKTQQTELDRIKKDMEKLGQDAQVVLPPLD